MKLDDIINMWEKDSTIDDLNLDDETKKSALLHSKYLRLLGQKKLKKIQLEDRYNEILLDKKLYYTGKMTKAQMDERGWEYDPFNGCSKPMKSEMDIYYKTDKELREIKNKIEYLKISLDMLEDIIGQIRFRSNSIKNVIEWKKFTAGV